MSKSEGNSQKSEVKNNPQSAIHNPQSVQWPQPTIGPYEVDGQYYDPQPDCCGPMCIRTEEGHEIAILRRGGTMPDQVLADAYLLAASWQMNQSLYTARAAIQACVRYLMGSGPQPTPITMSEAIHAIDRALVKARPPLPPNPAS